MTWSMSKLVAEPGVEPEYLNLNPHCDFSLPLSPIEGGPDYRGEISHRLEKDKRYFLKKTLT